ncbi:MAG: UDP-N-acetylglucosamine 2-epimerase (non-hydrolyzing) [Methanomicrobiales archaeon]|nr:UDP-N-acetylglucosamine 2-epimerase (non-hydrolyzing) [Methanomicrobiales archaeon]
MSGPGPRQNKRERFLLGVERVREKEPPEVVLVQGDTNTVLAGTLATAKLHIPVEHVEAGLRSFDRSMPEEINRVVPDHISDYLFAPTNAAREYLLNEGIPDETIHVTGNTIVDAVFQNLEIAQRKGDALSRFSLTKGEYFHVTAHRAENVDDKSRLQGIFHGLQGIQTEFDIPVIFPIHPRTQKILFTFGISYDGIQIIPPVGSFEFLQLEANARLVLTDSGGVQEETCILGVPCVTLRENTEPPETIDVGSNVLAGTDADRIVMAARKMLESHCGRTNPFGDGKAGKRIVEISKTV